MTTLEKKILDLCVKYGYSIEPHLKELISLVKENNKPVKLPYQYEQLLEKIKDKTVKEKAKHLYVWLSQTKQHLDITLIETDVFFEFIHLYQNGNLRIKLDEDNRFFVMKD